MTIKKGEKSQQWIVEQSVDVFNTNGIDVTLNKLASLLNVSRGRISHFFATRDSLFIAIGNEYQKKIENVKNSFMAETPNFTLDDLKVLFGRIMDNQYSYRCAILYAAGTGQSKIGMNRHVNESYRADKQAIRQLIETLVQKNELKKDVLDDSNYFIFEFQFVNLFTSWVISKEIYYPEQSYLEMKPLFLEGLFRLFDPYLIDKKNN